MRLTQRGKRAGDEWASNSEIKILKCMVKEEDGENEQEIKRGSLGGTEGRVKEGSQRAGERPQLAFLRFRCGTIAAYQSVST